MTEEQSAGNKRSQEGTIDNSGISDTQKDARQLTTAIPPKSSEGSITWTASEFVAHQKSASWYMILITCSIVLAFIVWLLTKDKITSGVFVVAGIVLAIFAAKKPREEEYRLDKDGLTIGQKLYPYGSFRSFAIVHTGAFSSLVFSPMKRFSLLTTVYYDPQDEQKIVAIASKYIPLEERKKDLLDDLLWRIRF